MKMSYRLTIGTTIAGIASGLFMSPGLTLGNQTTEKRPAEADLYMHEKDPFKNPKDVPGLPRVLLIGDSISISYTVPVRGLLKEKAVVHRPPVNCQYTGYGLLNLNSWLGTNHWDVIHFNWGIWDTHYLDTKGNLISDESKGVDSFHLRYTPEQYGENLSQLVDMLEKTGAKLVWASTTPVMSRSGKRFEDIAILNAVAEKIMIARNIPINDLYAYTLPQAKQLQSADKVHFSSEGAQRLGEQVSAAILDALQQNGSRL